MRTSERSNNIPQEFHQAMREDHHSSSRSGIHSPSTSRLSGAGVLAGLAPRSKTETNTNILRNKPLAQLTPSPDRNLRAFVEDRLERIKRPAEGWFFEKAIGPLSSLSPRDFQGIHEILQKTDEVKNIFSFGARSGGFELAMQFRHDINLNESRKGLDNSSASNYLDAISLEEHSYTEKKKLDGLDVYKMQNPFWDIGYKNGIEHAKKMIFFITPEWIASPYCLQEFSWLQETENKKIKTAFFIYKDTNMNDPAIEEIHKYAETNESLVMKALTPPEKGLHEVSISKSLPLSFKRFMQRNEFNYLKNFLSENQENPIKSQGAQPQN
ncbi:MULTISPECIES: hypothetical protein [Comamonadaceae]|uniref:hypothetical protein n=1 Tax=Acidovorax sacchari TaxID=3230736 RepID=UPI0034A28164